MFEVNIKKKQVDFVLLKTRLAPYQKVNVRRNAIFVENLSKFLYNAAIHTLSNSVAEEVVNVRRGRPEYRISGSRGTGVQPPSHFSFYNVSKFNSLKHFN